MTQDKKKQNTVNSLFGNSEAIADMVDYQADSIVSRTIVDKSAGTITLFAFDAGRRLSEHTAPYDAVVQVVEGTAELTIGGKNVSVTAGRIIIMPANVPHTVAAEERFKMLLTMLRA